jgi:hypothetical protein
MSGEDTYSFRTNRRAIQSNGEFAWGGDDGETWTDSIETSDGIEVNSDGSVVVQRIQVVDQFASNDLSAYTLTGTPDNEISTVNPYTGAYHGRSVTDGANKSMARSLSGLNNYPEPGDTFRFYMQPSDSHDVLLVNWGVQGAATDTENGVPAAGAFAAEIRFPDDVIWLHNSDSKDRVNGDVSFSHDGAGLWYYFRIVWETDGTQTVSLHRASDDYQYISWTYTDTTFTDGGIGWGQDNSDGVNSYCDWDNIYIEP